MHELVSPVDFRTILKNLAKLMTGVGFVLLVPLIAALIFGEYRVAAIYGLTVGGIISAGIIFDKLLPESELQKKEALFIAAVIFPFIALLTTVPLSETGMALNDAFFESVSAVTTTGLSVSSSLNPVFLFTRSWLQWIGGIGILLIGVLIFASPGTTALRLYTINAGEEKVRPTVYATAKFLLEIYLIITAISFILLSVGGMPFFDSVCHSLSSVSTGGFSTKSDSVSGFSGAALPFLLTLSCILGSVNFGVYSGREGIASLFKDIQLRYFIIFGFIGIVLLFITMIDYGSPAEIIELSVFQGLSALTTSGFSTVNPAELPEGAKTVLTALMWVGGSLGSTAGGIKIIRFIIILKILHLVFIRFFLPGEVLTPLKIGEDVIGQSIILSTVAFLFLYLFVIFVSSFIFVLHGFSLSDSLFEVSSALGTVGLSCGITDASLPVILKAVLIINMLLGRIEIIPIFILFYPGTWMGRRKK